MPGPLRSGDVWTVDDRVLVLSADLQDKGRRHKPRPVIIMAGPVRCADRLVPYVLCVPVTTKQTAHPLGRYEVELLADMGGLAEDSVAPVYLLQPIAKADLRERWGSIPDSQHAELLARLLQFLGAGLTRRGS